MKQNYEYKMLRIMSFAIKLTFRQKNVEFPVQIPRQKLIVSYHYKLSAFSDSNEVFDIVKVNVALLNMNK